MTLGRVVRVGVRIGLLLAPLIFFMEACSILANAGSFLFAPADFSLTLLRYLGYGSALGVAAAIGVFPITRRAVAPNGGALLCGLILATAFAIELGLYVFDIVAPLGGRPSLRSALWAAAVLGVALGVAVLTFAGTRRMWGRVAPLLDDLAWPRFLVIVTAESACALAAVWIGVTTLASAPVRGSAGPGRPNILLIVLDTVRADALSSSGNALADTPYLDRLAHEGARFSHAVSASTWTPPGHASLFTGLYPVSHGTRGLHAALRGDLDVLASILSDAGYATASLYNNPLAGRSNHMERGFEVAIGVETDTKVSFVDRRLYYKYVLQDSGARKTCELFQAWVKRCSSRGVRWFAFLNFNDAHAPYVPRQPWMREFLRRMNVDAGAVDLRLTWRAMSRSGPGDFRAGRLHLGTAELAWLRAAYYSEVRAIDHALQGAFEALRREGLLRNTVVAITADHGEALGEDGELSHAQGLFASVVRIPLILWAPDFLTPRVDDRWASTVDVLPTLLDLAGVKFTPRNYKFDGKSLLDNRRQDEAIAEHTSIDSDACESFVLLRRGEGLLLECDGTTRLLAAPGDALTTWVNAAPDAARANSLRRDLVRWREAALANHDPAATPGGSATSPAVREHLRALGYLE